MVVAIPLQGIAAQFLKKLQNKQMKIRGWFSLKTRHIQLIVLLDRRTKLMSEMLSNIKRYRISVESPYTCTDNISRLASR